VFLRFWRFFWAVYRSACRCWARNGYTHRALGRSADRASVYSVALRSRHRDQSNRSQRAKGTSLATLLPWMPAERSRVSAILPHMFRYISLASERNAKRSWRGPLTHVGKYGRCTLVISPRPSTDAARPFKIERAHRSRSRTATVSVSSGCGYTARLTVVSIVEQLSLKVKPDSFQNERSLRKTDSHTRPIRS
jgi:hypothetical protein